MAFKVILLGTGGGRHTTMFQARSTGGYLLMSDTGRVHGENPNVIGKWH